VVKNRRLPTVWKDAKSATSKLDEERVRLEFLTPPFAALVQAPLICIPMRSAVHCGEVWREDFKGSVARAGEVETIRDETT
jgi:hypothetical protein